MPDRDGGEHVFQPVARREPHGRVHHLARSRLPLGGAVARPVAQRARHDLEHFLDEGTGQRLAKRGHG